MTAETLQADIAEDATLHLGDCLEVLRTLPDCSVDAVVTDPPYGLSFMGKKWDYDVPAVEVWAECLRVLKPGGHLLAFAGTRTQHRMAVRIEDAGFEIRDMIAWVYGSGFPKSLDVSKAIDGKLKTGRSDSLALRSVNETRPGEAFIRQSTTNGHRGIVGSSDAGPSIKRDTPSTDAARQWQGWGTALKPALEPVTVARKPLAGTVAGNVLEHGTGALNIDGCRVGGEPSPSAAMRASGRVPSSCKPGEYGETIQNRITPERWQEAKPGEQFGRWPANLIHDGSDEVLSAFPDAPEQQRAVGPQHGAKPSVNAYGDFGPRDLFTPRGDTGSAARFFYTAKASRADRNDGVSEGGAPAVSAAATMRDCEIANWKARNGNHHPTVKPTDLMRYLCRLVTPPGGTVLYPFMGSGSTGRAALLEGFRFIGIEREAQYLEIARARVQSATPALWR
jgi:site-specific DNA-methyltransferase (adenine-specific)